MTPTSPKPTPATPSDAPAMASVHAQAFDAPWDEASILQMLGGAGAFGFVVVDEDPLGMVLARSLGGEAEILTLGVAPWRRRRGVAHALMQAAITASRETGASAMFLEVDTANTPAIALYERLGFARAGLRKAYYDRGAAGRADALVMRLDLGREAD